MRSIYGNMTVIKFGYYMLELIESNRGEAEYWTFLYRSPCEEIYTSYYVSIWRL